VTGAVERWFRDPTRFPPFARASLLVVLATFIVGALAPGPGEADPGPPTVRPVQALTTTTYGLPTRDLAAAQEAVAPTIAEVAQEMLRERRVTARLRAEAARWQSTLDRDITALLTAVASIGADATPVDISGSVDALFATAATRADRIQGLLGGVTDTVETLERHIGKASAAGVDTALYADVVAAARTWEQSQQRGADPYLCSSVLPEGAGEWSAGRLGDYRPYVDCLTERITPRMEAVTVSGHALNESLAALSNQHLASNARPAG